MPMANTRFSSHSHSHSLSHSHPLGVILLGALSVCQQEAPGRDLPFLSVSLTPAGQLVRSRDSSRAGRRVSDHRTQCILSPPPPPPWSQEALTVLFQLN